MTTTREILLMATQPQRSTKLTILHLLLIPYIVAPFNSFSWSSQTEAGLAIYPTPASVAAIFLASHYLFYGRAKERKKPTTTASYSQLKGTNLLQRG